VTLPRGFKADAERRAERVRSQLGRAPGSVVSALELAEHHHVIVVSAERLVERARLEELERLQSFAFSAATFDINGRDVIVTNPLRSDERLASDVAHELAHVLLKHNLSEVHDLDGVPFRTCRPDEEEQATALGATLLLPRPLLLSAARAGEGVDDLASRCGVTSDLARYRWNTTGVGRQIRR
jgi:Zn-dependent peptidase ImmA (M78 family)